MKTKLHRWIAATLLVTGTLVGTACAGDSPGNGEAADGGPTTTTAAATATPEAESTTEAPAAVNPAPEADSVTEAPAATSTAEPAVLGGDDAEPALWSNESEGPGRFRAEWFAKPFSFTIADAWVPAFAGAPDNANIRLPGVAILFVLETTAASSDALIANLSAIEGIELTDEALVEVGEQPGVRYTVAGEFDGPVAIATTAGEFTLGGPADEAARITVLELDGSVLVVLEVTVPDDPDTGWVETAAVIETIAWG